MNIADSVPDPVNPVALTDRLAQMERLQRIVETSDQLMIEIDPSGRFTFVNQAASSYFGMAPAACLGQPVTAFVHPERAIRKPDLWYHDSDHAVLIRSNLVCHDVHFDPIQRIMRPI